MEYRKCVETGFYCNEIICSELKLYCPKLKSFDVVFLGRLHPQKGILELMDIWEYMGDYSLVVIGSGELMDKCKKKAKGNITFVGEKYGDERDNIIKFSKVGVHPSTYDSGGMALAKILSFGKPGVSFGLDCLRTYYPKGVVKVPCFDKQKFADEIIRLLEDKKHYEKMSKEAVELVKENFDWEKRGEEIWNEIKYLL